MTSATAWSDDEHAGRSHFLPVVVLGVHPEDRDGGHAVLLADAARQLKGRDRLEQGVERAAEEARLLAGDDADGGGIGELGGRALRFRGRPALLELGADQLRERLPIVRRTLDALDGGAPRQRIGGIARKERGDAREVLGVRLDERANPRQTAQIDRLAHRAAHRARLRVTGHRANLLQVLKGITHRRAPRRTCYDSRRTEGVAALSLDESASFIAPSAFGPFRVLHQIGSGVLGPVFRTYEPQRDRLIAVKAFRLDLVPEDVARLADALRRLASASPTHPNLVPAVDAGLEGTTAYLAMDYVAGETLDVAFRHLAPAPLDRALPVLTQIADALEAGWAVGLGHGALHPRDAFLTAGADDVRVTGIGVVPALEATGVKAPVRRPYTAPERAAGEAWDIRADVYSLGAIAHELLTRRRPAGAGEQDGAFATGLTPEQRVHVRRVLAAALAERPEHRFPTPAAFATALTAVARGETPVLPPEPEPVAPPIDKHVASRKKVAVSVPLLEQLEPAPPMADAPAAPPAPAPAEAAVTPVIDLPVLPPVAEPAPLTPLPEKPISLEPVDSTVLSHFKSEGGREPAADVSPHVREVPAAAAPPPAAGGPAVDAAESAQPARAIQHARASGAAADLSDASARVAVVPVARRGRRRDCRDRARRCGRLPARHAPGPADGRRLSGGPATNAAAGGYGSSRAAGARDDARPRARGTPRDRAAARRRTRRVAAAEADANRTSGAGTGRGHRSVDAVRRARDDRRTCPRHDTGDGARVVTRISYTSGRTSRLRSQLPVVRADGGAALARAHDCAAGSARQPRRGADRHALRRHASAGRQRDRRRPASRA